MGDLGREGRSVILDVLWPLCWVVSRGACSESILRRGTLLELLILGGGKGASSWGNGVIKDKLSRE